MNHKLSLFCGWLSAALLIVTLAVAPVAAQGPAVRGVQPDSGRPGKEFDLTVRGDGFGGNEASPPSMRGPTAGERPEAYRAFLEEQLCGYVYNLIQEAGRLL